MRPTIASAIILILVTLAVALTACQETPSIRPPAAVTPTVPVLVGEPPDGYVVVAPSVLRAGQTESVSFSLLRGVDLTSSYVQMALMNEGRQIAETPRSLIKGKGSVPLEVPLVPEGSYELEVTLGSFKDRATVRIQEGTLLFLETDKPIYKPGQDIHVRVLTLDPELKPLPGEVTVEVQDAKGTKVFKRVVQTDEYGMTTVEMPLSTEPNLGVWKVTGHSGKQEAQVDVRVERYVLPKYEVSVDLPREWVLASEPISGTVKAEYSFGKPVQGEVEIVASRYVGVWEEFARSTQQIGGQESFELPAVGFVAGVPGAGGMGNVTLDIIVREKSTGYEEKTTRVLTVAASPVNLQVIPESTTFKPSLPLKFLIVTETPDNRPLDREVVVNLNYMGKDFERSDSQTHKVKTDGGIALLTVNPPEDAVALTVEAQSETAHASSALEASYSPSGNFIHLEQINTGTLEVGDRAQFRVYSTEEAANFYYEVISRGKVVYSQVSQSPDIEIPLTHLMAPSSRLLVYQILPNSEVAADYVPFDVVGDYPQQVQVAFSSEEVRPGDGLDINVKTQGPAKVGLVAVDRSVFILAENRLNLQQVFDDLERLYMQPQVELHEARFMTKITTRGARETFDDAGVVVLSNKKVPEGEEYQSSFDRDMAILEFAMGAVDAPAAADGAGPVLEKEGGSLAEVQRVRQFFPETWLWTDVLTDQSGHASVPVEAPDSITTWVLRATALSQEHGLGIAESELRVFQPFFLQVDLPYSAIRREELPMKIALYNYLDSSQEIHVALESGAGFDLLDDANKTVVVGPNDVKGVEFVIRPTELGVLPLKVSARSEEAADAVIKELLVEPEGVSREIVENLVLSAGEDQTLDLSIPTEIVPDSERVYIALTGSYLTQTIEGLEGLLQMPFGCGEQNMILLAPNVFVAEYLKETAQLKPEVMAKAEHLMITGYQRELTYRRSDGSFSAFGESDQEGSLWLTAFVLKTFAQGRDLMYVDQEVLDDASDWILQHQRPDGSFEPVGFLHHQELLGGLQGNTALTAYVAIALKEAGENSASSKAIRFLEGEVANLEDPYTLAIVSYALEMGKSGQADEAYDKLMSMAIEDDQGLHWGGGPILPLTESDGPMPHFHPQPHERSAAIETTGYATLALIERGDRFNASRSSRWLVSQRNAYGGFGSTQDTVVGLQALTQFASDARFDVDMIVNLVSGDWNQQVRITPDNADVLRTLEVPLGETVHITAAGKGQVVVQAVRRFNIPKVTQVERPIFRIDVDYGTDHVEVDELITVSVDIQFTPPEPIEAGMVVVDVSVPTGFAPVADSIQKLAETEDKIKRYDVAGRKVILYIEDMSPGESLSFQFQARALYPVRAKAVTSEVYSYYNPGWKGEAIGGEMSVVGR